MPLVTHRYQFNGHEIIKEPVKHCDPASRIFSYGTYALYREKALHESCQVLVEHAQRVAKIQFRAQAIHMSRDTTGP